MPWQMVQGDTLAEIYGALVECLPIEIELQVMLKIHAHVRTGSHRPECRPQLFVMHPDLDILPMQELIQAACVVEVQMSYDDFLDVLQLVTCSLYCIFELMLWLIPDSCKDVRGGRSPYCRIVYPAACFPEDEAFVRVIDQDAVHGQLATLVDKGLVFCAHQASVAAADNEALINF